MQITSTSWQWAHLNGTHKLPIKVISPYEIKYSEMAPYLFYNGDVENLVVVSKSGSPASPKLVLDYVPFGAKKSQLHGKQKKILDDILMSQTKWNYRELYDVSRMERVTVHMFSYEHPKDVEKDHVFIPESFTKNDFGIYVTRNLVAKTKVVVDTIAYASRYLSPPWSTPEFEFLEEIQFYTISQLVTTFLRGSAISTDSVLSNVRVPFPEFDSLIYDTRVMTNLLDTVNVPFPPKGSRIKKVLVSEVINLGLDKVVRYLKEGEGIPAELDLDIHPSSVNITSASINSTGYLVITAKIDADTGVASIRTTLERMFNTGNIIINWK